MDINAINNSISNLGNVAQQNLGKTGASHSTEQIKDEALNLTISQVYHKKRDELSQSLQSLNEGLAFTGVAKQGLEKQGDTLENVQKELYKANIDDSNYNPIDLKNNIAVHLQEFNDIAEDTKFKKQTLLVKEFNVPQANLNIITKDEHYTLEATNTKDVSTKLIQKIGENPLNSREDISKSLDDTQQAINELATVYEKYGEQEKAIEQSARNTITESIQLSKENARIRTIDFGKETADFSKTNVTSNIGHLVASQANIVQEQSVRLISK